MWQKTVVIASGVYARRVAIQFNIFRFPFWIASSRNSLR